MVELTHVPDFTSAYLNSITGPIIPGCEPLSEAGSAGQNMQPQSISTGDGRAASHRPTLQRPASGAELGTSQLDEHASDVVSLLSKFRAGFKTGTAASYVPFPRHRQMLGMPPNAPCWRIEVYGLTPDMAPFGLDILDDVVFGRGSEADFDLDLYGGYQKAVSRRHLLLRPTHRQIHLIDLGSTNGTLYNSIRMGRCASHVLASEDVITLGLLTVSFKIVDGPLVARP